MKNKVKVLCFCFAFVLSLAAQAGFIYDIHINSAENPSLSFGEVDAPEIATRSPFPPFSGMFGVIDVCFARVADDSTWYNQLDEDIKIYYDRLAEDFKTTAADNTWIFVSNSNTSLKFKLQAGEAKTLYIVYYDITKKDLPKKNVEIVDQLSFSVKTGGVYTITNNIGDDPAADPSPDKRRHVPKDESGLVSITPAVDGTAFAPTVMNISFAGGLAVVAYDGEVLGSRIPAPGITAADVDWTVEIVCPGYDVSYAWTTPYSILQITFTPTGSRAVGDLDITMTPNRSAKPISTSLEISGATGEQLTKVIDWMLQKFGTLDFDGDTVVTLDDAIYFYNFVSGGCDPDAIAVDLMSFSSPNATEVKAQAALDYFRANMAELYLDGTDNTQGILLDNAIYLYNFVSSNCDPDAVPIDLMSYASPAATESLAGTALTNMRGLLE